MLDRTGDDVALQLDNSEEGWTTIDYITTLNIDVYEMVEYQRQASDDSVTGFVVRQQGDQYLIQLEDRSQEWVPTRKLRVIRDAPILSATERRFNLRVMKTPSCWWWPQYDKQSSTYIPHPRYSTIDGHATHRLSYRLSNGHIHIPSYYVVRHRCGNPGCVNPAHLTLGESWENALDEVARRRQNKQPGDLFTYEDDLEALIAEYEAQLNDADAKLGQELEHRLDVMYSKRISRE
jgi:hypothetical protein